ncbi:Chaperone protein DnaJ [Acaryochloris thomasi RCC1774]|uniref:Chaperone protein DnaJ n=1 Tax=Acaryochloris thomasi RCC1774 TaxID=1764569 RepID=A0A2W1JJJ7_9CYAN|nr:J domain-containing protein [Acaryochloris thomasi]PZD73579.1 Chaperone protein DnaJ [Acaryochloris thomasi RCC1774]
MLEVTAHLQILELESNASLGEIKQAYKDLVTVWHPDRFGHNPRLREKAEGKLKQFNQAYEALRSWQGQSPSKSSRRAAAPPAQQPQSAPRRRNRSRTETRTKSYRKTPMSSDSLISFATAEYILQNYCFTGDLNSNPQQQCYQGGPFVLRACADPPEVMLSVPCDSVRFFDRILLSIPCKSAGHFKQQEATRLLELLHAQQR